MRVWRVLEEVALQLTKDIFFQLTGFAVDIICVKMNASGCARKYACVTMDVCMRAKIHRSAQEQKCNPGCVCAGAYRVGHK